MGGALEARGKDFISGKLSFECFTDADALELLFGGPCPGDFPEL